MNRRSIARLAVFVLFVSPPLLADQVKKKSFAVVQVSKGRGDQAIADLFRDAIKDTKKVTPSARAEAADCVGKLEVIRGKAGTELDLSVQVHGGAYLAALRKLIEEEGSIVGAAQELANEAAAVCAGPELAAEQTRSGQTELPARSPVPVIPSTPVAPAPAAAAPAPATAADENDHPQPVKQQRDRDDWSGEVTRHFDPPKPKQLDFLAGAELGYGPWFADGSNLSGPTGFDFAHYGPAFTRTIDRRWHPAMNLHGGWKFLGYGAVEAAFQSSLWIGPGGATLAGVRFSGFPLQAFLPERKIDLGIELGGGYAFVAAGSYDMSGSYFTFGLTAEYPLNNWIGVTAFYRLFTPFLKTFYVNYKAGITEPVDGFTAVWHTLGIGLNLHFSKTI